MTVFSKLRAHPHSDAVFAGLVGFAISALAQLPPIVEANAERAQRDAQYELEHAS